MTNARRDADDVVAKVELFGDGGDELAQAEGDRHASGDRGLMLLGVRKDTATALAASDGDYIPFICDDEGRVYVASSAELPELTHAEDTAHQSGDSGVMLLGVRADTPAATAANGDYHPILVDADGRVHVLDKNSAAIKTAVELLDNAISGTEMQVDIVTMPADTFVAEGSALGKGVLLQGDDGTDRHNIAVDTSGRVKVDIAEQSDATALVVDATGSGDVPVTLDSEVVSTQPFVGISEAGLTEIIGADEQVDQNDYSASVGIALGGTYSGEILSIGLYTTEDNAGDIRTPDGVLYFLDADPATTAGDTSITAGERVTILGKVAVANGEWDSDANGGFWYTCVDPIPFHALSTICVLFKLTSATSFNDGGTDDERLKMNFWYRRES